MILKNEIGKLKSLRCGKGERMKKHQGLIVR